MERPPKLPDLQENRSENSERSELRELAIGIAHVALEANDMVSRLRVQLRKGNLTEVEIDNIGNDVERYVYREICDLLKVDEATRLEALRER